MVAIRHRLPGPVLAVAALLSLRPTPAAADIFVIDDYANATVLSMDDAPSAFGPMVGSSGLEGALMISQPPNACTPLNVTPPSSPPLRILLIERGRCQFQQKVLNAQRAGFAAAIVYNVGSDDITPMRGDDGAKDVTIPSFFVGFHNGIHLTQYANASRYHLRITSASPFDFADYLIPFAVVIAVCFVVLVGIMLYRCWADHRRLTRHRLPKRALDSLPVVKFDKAVHSYDTCAICLDDYEEGEQLRILPCNHAYHTKCVDPWLTRSRRVCPVCKQRVRLAGDPESAAGDSDSDSPPTETEREPLIPRRQRRGYGATTPAAGRGDRAAAVGGSRQDADNTTQPPRRPHRSSRRSRRQQRAAAAAARSTSAPAPSAPAAENVTALQQEEPTFVVPPEEGTSTSAQPGPSIEPSLQGRRRTRRGYQPLTQHSDADPADGGEAGAVAVAPVEPPISDRSAPIEPVVVVVSPAGGGRPRAPSTPEPAAGQATVLAVAAEGGDGPDGRGDDRV